MVNTIAIKDVGFNKSALMKLANDGIENEGDSIPIVRILCRVNELKKKTTTDEKGEARVSKSFVGMIEMKNLLTDATEQGLKAFFPSILETQLEMLLDNSDTNYVETAGDIILIKREKAILGYEFGYQTLIKNSDDPFASIKKQLPQMSNSNNDDVESAE